MKKPSLKILFQFHENAFHLVVNLFSRFLLTQPFAHQFQRKQFEYLFIFTGVQIHASKNTFIKTVRVKKLEFDFYFHPSTPFHKNVAPCPKVDFSVTSSVLSLFFSFEFLLRFLFSNRFLYSKVKRAKSMHSRYCSSTKTF